ncbi:MAG: PIN domain-containing protein [Candidatus Eremiobacteraeota bacterium]|nr:PIN domain-containing protein [Candidatus Eremiobacteraeota bacterium]
MVLVDTSVWIEYLKHGHGELGALLEDDLVLTHPFVLGELACGNLHQRARILNDLATLPSVSIAHHDEVIRLVERRRIYGKGVGWVDAHLIASALISHCRLYTSDRRLLQLATECDVAHESRN